MDDKQDPTKLTSFHPLTPVSSSNGFSLSRIFEFGRRKTSRTPKLPATPEQSRKLSAEETRKQTITEENVNINAASSSKIDGHDKKENFYSWLTESVTSQAKLYGGKEPPCEVRLTQSETQTPRKEKWRYRNVRTILRRLSALTIDRRWHQSTGDFKHNFKQYWMPDEHCKECYECGEKFNTFRRRHHCRVCGQIFCYRCCNEEVPGKIIGFSGDIRVCNYCYKIVQAYLNDDLEKSIEALSEDIKAFDPNYGYEFGGSTSSLCSLKSGLHFDDSSYRVKRTGSCSSIANNGANERSPTPVQRSPFDAFGVAPSEANQIKQLQDYLTELWCHITNSKTGIELASHRYKLKTYHNCFAGSELVDWMVKNNKASTRTQAQFTGQALLDNNWIELVCPYEQNVFKDEYMLYQPTETALLETETASMAAQLHATSANYSDDSSVERKFSELDDDDQAPKWFKQLSSITPLDENDLGHSVSVLSQSKRFSAGRHLNLDHVTAEDTDVKKADLSLQMNLDTQRLDNVKREMNVDEASKISFITHVPPLPLDTYVCVEGHQSAMKKKVVKPSNPVISEDILRGVVFPRPNTEPEAQGENSDDFGNDESGERLARERLSYATFHHVNALMKQLLRQDNLLPTWEEIIMPFISKISDQVVPDVRRDDDMDIRRYVWFTKVPGGLKKDSHLISGVVFCKNISHKRMADYFLQPKILMMSCAIEYQRVENKMSSLDPLVLQEHAFLQNFVKRILALKPNILLVEKNVARVAQDMLLAGGVTLVHNIKPSIMENIARCTGADILSTMEQVTRPRFGTCQQFRLQKYPLPKTKESKTLMYFDGCAPDLGCSLILRGGNEKTLLKIKKIIKYLIYVSYHLKLENKFLMDEFSMPPPLEQLTPQLYQSLTHPQQIDDTTTSNEPVSCDVIREAENSVASVEVAESDKFADALNRIILTSSPFCNYFMPYLLTEDGKVCPSRQFIAPRVYWSRYLDGSVSEPLTLAEDDHEWVENQELISPGTIVKPPHPFTDPSKLLDCIENSEQRASLLNDFRARGGRIDLKMYHKYEERESQRVYGKYWKKLSAVTVDLEEDCKEEEALEDDIAIELTPDPKHDCFDAYNHQKMAVLFSSYPSESRAPKPCITPWAVYMEFYGRNDITLGGFLERYCFRPSYICPSPHCSVPMVNHVRYFAHGKGSLYIHMRNLESPIPGYDRTILTWSWCKICKQVTPVVPLSFESYSISFAKYLELRFYGSQYTRRASAEPCGHSLHHDHYQYFSYGNMVASFKYGAIDLYEVILPSDDIVVGKKRHSQTLVNEVEDIYAKVESFPKIIMDRLNGLKSADPQPFSASREAKIKEFITDLQKEQSNLQDCVRVIKKKADALVKKMSISDGTDSKSSDGTSFRSETNQLESLKSNSTSAIPSSAEAARENVTTVDLNDDEKYLLTIDIGNKLFHLKKSMCESVENWNLKLQEFITQDRKREKTVVRSASPVKQPNFPTDITEFYPDLTRVEMDPARPKMLNRETVSEVYLTGGKILRQTYFGNTPSPHPGDSGDTELPAQVRKTSGQIASSRKVSESNLSTTSKDRKDLTLPLTSGQETSAANTSFDKTESERNKVGSPYMLISSLKESVKNSPEDVNSDLKKDSLESKNDEAINVGNILPTKLDNETVQSSNIEASHSQDINVVMDLDVTKPPIDITSETKCSDGDPIDNWVSQGDHITPVRSESIFHSDSEMSLGVEYSSDQDDLSDNQSMLTEDDQDPNLPESEVQSEVEIAEEENDIFEDSIQLGESAVDFVDRALSPNGSVKKDTSKAGIPIAHKKSISVEIPSPLASHSPVTTTQVTSGITNNSATKQKITKSGGSSISITKLPAFTEFPKFRKEEKVEKIEYLTPKEVKAMQVARRRRTEWEYRSRKPANSSEIVTAPKVSVSSKEPLPIKDDHFSKLKSTAKQKSVKESPTMKHSSAKDRKSNPLIKRLVQNALESTEGKKKGKVTPVKQVTAKNKRYSIQSLFKPIKVDKNTEGDHPLSPDKLEEQDHAVEKPTENKAAVSSTDAKPLSNYQKRKMMGHRRMKSAPLRVAPKEEECIPSEVTPESPYVYLNPMDQDVVRERSRSLGNKHVYKEAKQLSKMAELVCHEDRVDAERDVPEVVQYNSNPTTNITSIAGITYIVNQQILQNADDKRPFDETAKKVAKPDTDVPDASKLTSGTGEAATVNRRGGSEKMKKMIANWLPGVNFQPIPRPFPSSEQYMPQVNGTSFIVINEKEPTSLIAFTLSSQDYSNQLQNIQDMMAGKKVTNMLLQRTLSSQPNTPSLSRKQVGIDERIGSNSPTIINNPSEASVILRNNISFQSLRPRSWAAPNDGIDETDCFSGDNTNADSPVLKRVAGVGKRHPLASVELDPIMDSLEVDDSVSCDDVLDGSESVKSGEDVNKKKEEKSFLDYHIKLQFQNNVAKFYCSVYYAEQFRQLRELIFPEGEERFIQSLARCMFWKATGGKSGSSFSKSLDDRFVMKQMSRLEVQSFVDFAPRYFSYINKAIKEKRPTAMAKLLGVYRIGFKNSVTNTTMRQDVLVMENLFYERKVNKIFDLKGSVRGRYVQTSVKEDVLMDENLLEMISESPLFIRAHSKAVLSKAIYNDTEFLSTNLVMDYSLLVGIDKTNCQLVVGIIDYIRTYTWDKKLESYVKSTGILGGQGKMPTVISPDAYRDRYTQAMQRYFLMVPDKWTGFGADLNLIG